MTANGLFHVSKCGQIFDILHILTFLGLGKLEQKLNVRERAA